MTVQLWVWMHTLAFPPSGNTARNQGLKHWLIKARNAGREDGSQRQRGENQGARTFHLFGTFIVSSLSDVTYVEALRRGLKGFNTLPTVQMSACFSSCGTRMWSTSCGMTLAASFYPLWGGRWRAEVLASCGYYSPPADADLPYKAKECQKWGRAGSVWSELSRLPVHFTWARMEANARHPHVHTHTEILKNQQFPGLRRWKLCKLSCSDLQ